MDGVILINKEKGILSHRVIQSIRKIYPGVKTGHIGTLDPAATGLLPVMLGAANRLHSYLSRGRKGYRAAVFLGQSTDTYDSEGTPVSDLKKVNFGREEILDVLSFFQGVIEQVPPLYSAVKVNGKSSYKYARAGNAIELKSRKVEIYSLSLEEFEENILRIEIYCSQGTYIRSIANDIGKKLGCGAYLLELERTAVGEMDVLDAVSIARLRENPEKTLSSGAFRPLERLLPSLPSLQTLDEEARLFSCGGRIGFNPALLAEANGTFDSLYQKIEDPYVKVFFRERFIGMGLIESGMWVKPIAVFSAGLEM